MTTPDERPPFRLADEEEIDLRIVHARRDVNMLLAHVTDLCEAYYAAGLVEGDLAHDGTVRWEAGA